MWPSVHCPVLVAGQGGDHSLEVALTIFRLEYIVQCPTLCSTTRFGKSGNKEWLSKGDKSDPSSRDMVGGREEVEC